MKLTTVSKKFAPLCVALSVSLALGGCGEKSMDEHLEAARGYTQQQDTEAAIIEYKNAIKADPKSGEARFELGRLYIATNQMEAAEKELNRALELGYSASEIIPLLSKAYQQTGAENALVDMEIRHEGMSESEAAEVAFYKLQALVQLDKQQEAQMLIEEVSQMQTDSVYQSLSLAYPDIMQKDYAAALEKTQAAAEKSPDNNDVLLQLAKLSALTGDLQAAINNYKAYVDANPNDLSKKFALVSLLIETRQVGEASPYVSKMLKQYPNNGLLNQYQGIIESAKENYEAALIHLEKAIQSGQAGPAARLIAGYAAYKLEDYSATSQHLSMIASNLPDNHPALRMLADSLLRQGDNEEATMILSRVDGENETDAALFSKAGFQLLREGNMVDAQKMIDKSSELSQEAEDLARLGVLQLSVNDVEGLVNLQSAAEQAPDNVATQKTLLAAYVNTGQSEKAREMANKWIENNPDDPAPYIYLAELALKEKNIDEATSMMNKASELGADNRQVQLAQAKLYIISEKYQDAEKLLESVLKQDATDTKALGLLYASVSQRGGDKAQIKTRIEETLSKNKDDEALRLALARLQFADQNYDDVLDTLATFKANKNAPKGYWQMEGQALLRSGAVKKAQDHYKKWVTLYPADKGAVLGKLLLDDAQNNHADALSTINSFLEKRPDTQVRVLKAYFLAVQKKPGEARKVLENVPEQVLEVPFVRGITARINLLEGNEEAAIEDAKAAYDDTANPKNTLLVVASLESAGKKEETFAFLQEHYQAHPDDIRATMLYAERLIGTDRQQAKEIYSQVLEKLPDNFVVLNNLAYLHMEDGELGKAQPLARRAVDLQPRSADAVDTFAQILLKRERYEPALKLYDKVDVEKIRNDMVYLNYVEVLVKNDKKQLAERRLSAREFSGEAQQRAQLLQSQL